MPHSPSSAPASVADVAEGLRAAGYLPGESTALVAYLATRLGKPVLVEGPAGRRQDRAGQGAGDATSAASSCACSATRASTRPRRCMSGTTASSCCASRPRPTGTGWAQVQDDIFGEEFLLARPLMTAIASEQPVVLLIDEIDKTDQEFEAMLLELLSDFQISIPELGRVAAAHAPGRAADLQQLARADRGAQAPLPVPVARLPRRSSTSSRSCACTRPSSPRPSRASSSR